MRASASRPVILSQLTSLVQVQRLARMSWCSCATELRCLCSPAPCHVLAGCAASRWSCKQRTTQPLISSAVRSAHQSTHPCKACQDGRLQQAVAQPPARAQHVDICRQLMRGGSSEANTTCRLLQASAHPSGTSATGCFLRANAQTTLPPLPASRCPPCVTKCSCELLQPGIRCQRGAIAQSVLGNPKPQHSRQCQLHARPHAHAHAHAGCSCTSLQACLVSRRPVLTALLNCPPAYRLAESPKSQSLDETGLTLRVPELHCQPLHGTWDSAPGCPGLPCSLSSGSMKLFATPSAPEGHACGAHRFAPCKPMSCLLAPNKGRGSSVAGTAHALHERVHERHAACLLHHGSAFIVLSLLFGAPAPRAHAAAGMVFCARCTARKFRSGRGWARAGGQPAPCFADAGRVAQKGGLHCWG